MVKQVKREHRDITEVVIIGSSSYPLGWERRERVDVSSCGGVRGSPDTDPEEETLSDVGADACVAQRRDTLGSWDTDPAIEAGTSEGVK